MEVGGGGGLWRCMVEVVELGGGGGWWRLVVEVGGRGLRLG